jgi:hypothetical protein
VRIQSLDTPVIGTSARITGKGYAVVVAEAQHYVTTLT